MIHTRAVQWRASYFGTLYKSRYLYVLYYRLGLLLLLLLMLVVMMMMMMMMSIRFIERLIQITTSVYDAHSIFVAVTISLGSEARVTNKPISITPQ